MEKKAKNCQNPKYAQKGRYFQEGRDTYNILKKIEFYRHYKISINQHISRMELLPILFVNFHTKVDACILLNYVFILLFFIIIMLISKIDEKMKEKKN